MAPEILIRGAGEIASAIAHVLHRAGFRVALQACRPPIAIRRPMAFSDAVFDGSAELEGIRARLIHRAGEVAAPWVNGEIPLLYMTFEDSIAARPWSALVDARMNKQQVPDHQIGLAPVVIGLGPGCTTGLNVDVAVETSWDGLGTIIRRGSTLPLSGEPRAVLGQARTRFRYAPQAGVLRAEVEIGQRVSTGQIIARVADAPVTALFDGIVRGLTRDGVPVEKGNKIAEIDPRPEGVKLTGIDDRPRRLAEAVATILTPMLRREPPPGA